MEKKLIALFIFLSFITQTFTEQGTNAILSRLTPGDVFGALALFFGLGSIFTVLRNKGKYSNIYKLAIFMVFCFISPVLFSLNPQSTMVECLIIFFLILLSVLIFYNYKDNLLDKLLPLIMYVAIVASILGVYDYIASIVGLPRLFPARAGGEILSGFRNAGQAGAYFLVIITILYPLRYSSLYDLLNKKNKKLLNISLLFSLIFLALTGKVAAYIGILIGIFGYAMMNRNIKTIITLSFTGLILIVLFNNLEAILPEVYNRISHKYNSRISDRIDGDIDSEDDFITNNLASAISAFEDRPLIGSGLGGFHGNYARHEVHSTYFKMIGETGLLGTFGYLVFIFSFFSLLKFRKYAKINPYSDYLRSILPFILGCLVSWGYTFHLRKREFWILLAILMIINYRAKLYKKLKTS